MICQLYGGVCVEFPQGWWTYRWCHKQQVTQYHKGKNGEAMGNSWSLGVYDSHKTMDGDEETGAYENRQRRYGSGKKPLKHTPTTFQMDSTVMRPKQAESRWFTFLVVIHLRRTAMIDNKIA